MSGVLRIAAIATAALLPTSAPADMPLWQAVKGEYAEHRLFIDHKIAGDARFASLLKTTLDAARGGVQSSDDWAREAIEEARKSNAKSSPRSETDEKLQLLGDTGGYAAILQSVAHCVFSCSSDETILVYRLTDHKLLKPNDVLDLSGQQAGWLTKLANRDRNIEIGPPAIECGQARDSEDCLPLSDVIAYYGFGNEPDIDVRHLAGRVYLGFTTRDGGTIRSLDLYISRQRVGTHFQVYKWPLSVEDVASLLRPEMRALAANTKPASPAPTEPKPDAIIKTQSVRATVQLDDKIKADPALAADSLAEGKKWIDKNAAEAAASRKSDPQFFRDGGWEFERKYSVRSVVGDRYVSVVRDDYMDTHAAHPNSNVDTILWDKTAAKRISIRPFFTETADNGATMKAMQKAVIASLKAEKKKRDAGDTATNDWFKDVQPSLLKIGAVTLAPSTEVGKSSGLTFHYPPYAVGPYAEGQYVAFVPWETLKPYLTPEGARIFGGARPKGDEDSGQ